MNEDLTAVGKNLERTGGRGKVTGAVRYVADLHLPGMLAAKLLRSPHAHARVVRVEAAAARQLEGVRAVLTPDDVPAALLQEEDIADGRALADKARFAGDEVVAVAADTLSLAEQALEVVEVEYEVLPALLTTGAALAEGAPLIPPPEVSCTNSLVHPARTMRRDWGDVEQGFAEAGRVYEESFSFGCVQHLPLEPKAFVARWHDDRLDLWATLQRPFIARHIVAGALGLPEASVRIRVPYLGGAFGSKSESTRYLTIVALLSRLSGRPVKLVLTREEDMLARNRPGHEATLRLGVDGDGAFTAVQYSLAIRSGGYNACHSTSAGPNIRTLFRSRSCRYEAESVYTNHPPGGQMRGVLDTFASFAMATTADRVAEELGYPDPFAFYARHHVRPGDDCGTVVDADGVTCSSCGLDECLERAREASGWDDLWKGWDTPVSAEGGRRVGIGVSGFVHDSGLPWVVTGATLTLNMDGTAQFLTPVTDLGNATVTTQTQVVAEASGIAFADIRTVFGDTAVTPVDPVGQVGSGTAHVRSLASRAAGADARRQILERAAAHLGVPTAELDIAGSVIFERARPQSTLTLRALMAETGHGMASVVGSATAVCPHFPEKAFNWGAHIAVVEVDTATGDVRVLRYVAAHDVGRALNPAVVESQIQGGVVQGIGVTLTEELSFADDGRPRNLNLWDYKILTAADVPAVVPLIVETRDHLSAYGAKGFAEAPLVGVPGCIGNALRNAIGVRFTELPITPEKVLRALGKLPG